VTLPRQTGFFGHPAGLRTLFFAEMWERFSYYGMRALLTLFMVAPLAAGGMGWSTEKAGPIYGLYTSMVYLVTLPGGWIADRVLGQRKSVFWGGAIIMSGHIALAVPSVTTFFLGLALVVTGTGLLKPNISTMVGQLYARDDDRRDAGFAIFYMGINLGALTSPLVTGYLAQSESFKGILRGWGISPEYSWHWGFAAAAVGMFFGLVWYLVDHRALGEAGLRPVVRDAADAAQARRRLWQALGATVGILALFAALNSAGIVHLTAESISKNFAFFLVLLTLAFFVWLFKGNDWSREERSRLWVIVVLFIGASVFWSVFEQAGSTLTLFADRSTNNSLFGASFPSSWWQSANSAMIVALTPVFAWMWVKLGKRAPSDPAKFAVGLLFVSASFFLMVPAAMLAGSGNRVGWYWLFACYILQTVGELWLSPVGLSAMTKLAPARVGSLMMGVWFLAASVGNYIGGRVAGFYDKFSLPTLFAVVACYALVFTVVLALLVKPMKRMMANQ
jgi:POT family proton-dependent oligopeptide transporter